MWDPLDGLVLPHWSRGAPGQIPPGHTPLGVDGWMPRGGRKEWGGEGWGRRGGEGREREGYKKTR